MSLSAHVQEILKRPKRKPAELSDRSLRVAARAARASAKRLTNPTRKAKSLKRADELEAELRRRGSSPTNTSTASAVAARQSPPAACSPTNTAAASAQVADDESLDAMEVRYHGSTDSAERAELFAKLETRFLEELEAESDPVAYNQIYKRLTQIEAAYIRN